MSSRDLSVGDSMSSLVVVEGERSLSPSGGDDFLSGERDLFLGIGADIKSSVTLASTVESGKTNVSHSLCCFSGTGDSFGERECDDDEHG